MELQRSGPTAWPSLNVTTTGGLILRRFEDHEVLVAVRAFRAGEVIFSFDHATWRIRPDAFTVQDARGRPVHDPLLARVARAGRADGPNCRADFGMMALIASRRIAVGEILALAGPEPVRGLESLS